jgi:hypothetical protein
MCSRGVLVHRPSRLGTRVAVLAAEFQCGDGMLATSARERGQTLEYCDRVMSHSFKCSRLSEQGSALKLPGHISVQPVGK